MINLSSDDQDCFRLAAWKCWRFRERLIIDHLFSCRVRRREKRLAKMAVHFWAGGRDHTYPAPLKAG